jgi:hypothetical protein
LLVDFYSHPICLIKAGRPPSHPEDKDMILPVALLVPMHPANKSFFFWKGFLRVLCRGPWLPSSQALELVFKNMSWFYLISQKRQGF